MNRFGFENSDEHNAWLARVVEPPLEPDLPMIDAHHHFMMGDSAHYLFEQYLSDVTCGHNIVASVFAECHAMYRREGPAELRCVGESEYVAGVAAMSDSGRFGPARVCRAMMGAVDMTLGVRIAPVLDAHEAASGGRFRGVRVSAPWHEAEGLARHVDAPDYLARADIRQAIGVLAARGLSLDIWVYHTQLDQVVALARAFPGLVIVLNHYGAPILGGPYRGREDEVFADWREKMRAISTHPNVFVKTGAMVIRARDRANPDLPPSSEDVSRGWQRWNDTVVELFGAGRCLFESNFPVHKNWVSFPVLCNAFKRMTSGFSADEKSDFFAGAARRAYRIDAA